MPSDFPLYYAGVADEDMLDEFLVGRRQLDHGQSSTMDVRRFINVKYQQASVGKIKKAAAATTIAVLFIIIVMFTIGSPRTENLPLKSPLADTTESKREEAAKTQLSFALATNIGTPFQLSLKCNACALVSSSGILLGSNAGSQIDSTDCVFRLNSAPTLGFEKDVGSKTTIRVQSAASFKSLIRETWKRTLNSFEDADYFILLGSEKLLCKNCTLSKLYERLSHYLGNTKLLQVTKENYEMVRQEWSNLGINVLNRQGFPISTRFYTLNLARHVCGQIRIFGMELENPCERLSSVPLFYWDQDSWQRECLNQEKAVQQKVIQGVKRLQLESKIFRSWARGYHMEFFYPSQSMK
ncbi:alpha-N-acetyl-neuraminyl-2,3-beta-galactosyl-1,3-N-acetyl-galactosaminide alpha-2,6-sialyltransferase-like isoform X3 [Acropora millepora]|uniref:alpha-N-acetyl-neuraminyl-2,3-beta-galactosyl-1, 3-N-acetyl-galactosaminide alpha-2,6-sialyltransferase-like isoform X3 n=1 Tax=Acropora millepora TaxID=45264 RepID=UPI001CF12CC4|nr:alpha-N-acetyl-neuraminyl-2,3-beta-galactosyl-1,3-N-acetyl-galactosaminide alpha-2,6-sialyltransferase-like isoform X3 [Acropora millepora]